MMTVLISMEHYKAMRHSRNRTTKTYLSLFHK